MKSQLVTTPDAAAQEARMAAQRDQRVLVMRFMERRGMDVFAPPAVNQGIEAVEATGWRFQQLVEGPDTDLQLTTYAVFTRLTAGRARSWA